ncbi:type I pullulanase [Neobacillus notoginsengisoli]|uniref:Type I pullulanase n=1 Tax=Neobacillus notoginsengisoli TaxID=1578198 RepID=A0A417YUH4_9BACI|nr:type I pullulanase [Neobacillus notoginsengisoli]RHW40792.1 type I pullulanase [Neobacillus notoginsengisoli]
MADNSMAFLAYLDRMNAITVLLPLPMEHPEPHSFILQNNLGEEKLTILDRHSVEGYLKLVCGFSGDYLFGTDHWVLCSNGNRADVQIGEVIRTREFDETFYYDGDDLGASCKDRRTIFKLWAPTATMAKLKLYPPGAKYFELVKMARNEKGVWSVEMDKELELYRYTYMVSCNKEWSEAVDPYAVAVTANGALGVVAKLERTEIPRIQLPPFSHPADAIIYETHIRDFTIHPQSGTENKGLYIGAAEENTVGPDGKATGITHVKELGITHIEFLPFNDFAGVDETSANEEYNWGYNPLHFNAPEGSYSSDAADPYVRIRELKAMIETIHSLDLRVMMDVVYNHVYIREQSSFEKIVPGYFFRYDEAGLPSDGTGVGNDFATERLMARKFILDSVRFWVEEYNIDGLRVDLMGILDVQTVNEVRQVCNHIKPGMLIIGEGWELNTPLPQGQKATIRNQHQLPCIGHFNDRFRDSIKGSTFNLYERGYALGNGTYTEQAKEAIAGSIGFHFEQGLFSEPGQSVNYVESHDNHTLWDKLEACFEDVGELLKMKCHRLATSLVLLSQGIPFLHSGQEFFRTKGGEGNSYKSPDSVNRLDWERKASFPENVRYIKGIIEIRKAFSCFRMRTAGQIKADMRDMGLDYPLIGFSYENGKDEKMLLLVNPTAFIHHIELPRGEWAVLADDLQAGTAPLRVIPDGEKVVSEPVSLMVFLKK